MRRDLQLRHDWGREGIDWRDASMDNEMAQDWLRATHSQENEKSQDVFARVRELVQTDLDPARGWRLTKRIVQLAEDEPELRTVGRQILSPLLKWHEDLVGAELAELVRTDSRFRQAFYGQFPSTERSDFQKRFGIEE